MTSYNSLCTAALPSPDRNGYPTARIGLALARGVKVDSGKQLLKNKFSPNKIRIRNSLAFSYLCKLQGS
jgi:hypothetical protein